MLRIPSGGVLCSHPCDAATRFPLMSLARPLRKGARGVLALMGYSRGQCGICAATGGAREIVDRLLSLKTSLREVSKLTSFSRASLHRHAQRCFVHAQAAAIRASKFDPKSGIITVWPDGSQTVQRKGESAENAFVKLRFTESEIRNPSALESSNKAAVVGGEGPTALPESL